MAINRFNHVDLLFEDVEFNNGMSKQLNEFILTKQEQNEKRRK